MKATFFMLAVGLGLLLCGIVSAGLMANEYTRRNSGRAAWYNFLGACLLAIAAIYMAISGGLT